MNYIKQLIKTPIGDYEIEIEDTIHDLGKSFKELIIPEDMRLLTI